MYTNSDIYYITDRQGLELVVFPRKLFAPKLKDNRFDGVASLVVSDAFNYRWEPKPVSKLEDKEYLVALAGSVKVIGNWVKATVQDAHNALVLSGGQPVKGWRSNLNSFVAATTLCDVETSAHTVQQSLFPFALLTPDEGVVWYPDAWYREVRIEYDLSAGLVYKGDLLEVTKDITSFASSNMLMAGTKVVSHTNGSRGSKVLVSLVDDPTNKWLLSIDQVIPFVPGYGYTLEGKAILPPEGYTIVPEKTDLTTSGFYYADGEWSGYTLLNLNSRVAEVNEVEGIRAYAQPIKVRPSKEDIEKGFNDYWGSGLKRRAFDAFAAGVAWENSRSK